MTDGRIIRLTLEYDGTAYHGWQRQAGDRTVQEELERHLATVLRERVRVTGAGRTDAGCHALGQVASFPTHDVTTPLWRLRRSLNALLGGTAAVIEIAEAPPGFDARKSARRRHYLYLIGTRPAPLWRDRFWEMPIPVDFGVLSAAAGALRGRHDFTAFTASGGAPRGALCTIHHARWCRWHLGYRFDIVANRFLHHMVRSLVGTMVEIGRGAEPVELMARLLAAPDRTHAGPTAPAYGLYLAQVSYEEE